jgi:hypothetical protein
VNHFVAATAISRERVMSSPPPNGVIKIKWDAAINKTKGCIGLGIMARDCMGLFLGGSKSH